VNWSYNAVEFANNKVGVSSIFKELEMTKTSSQKSEKPISKNSEIKQALAKEQLRFKPNVKIFVRWRVSQDPPTVEVKGNNWVIICSPDSEEEYDRMYCKISHTKPDNSVDILEDGDIGAPLNASTYLCSNLATGTHTFTAYAEYDDSVTITKSVQVTI
jgi:hypothetical protein